MISLAAPQGSVGPHVDTYDVFLLQGRGRRRWRIAERFVEAYRPGLDLRVLRGFRAEREWVLEPGDMLYLPPGVAHHGVALEECLTYSIGLRAPAEVDLVAGFLQRAVASADRSRLYADPDLVPAREPGEISAAALEKMRGIVATRGRRATVGLRPLRGRAPDGAAHGPETEGARRRRRGPRSRPARRGVTRTARGRARGLRAWRRGARCSSRTGGTGRSRAPWLAVAPALTRRRRVRGGVDPSLSRAPRLPRARRRAHPRRRLPRRAERRAERRKRSRTAAKSAGIGLATDSAAPVRGWRSCNRAAWSMTRGAARGSPP